MLYVVVIVIDVKLARCAFHFSLLWFVVGVLLNFNYYVVLCYSQRDFEQNFYKKIIELIFLKIELILHQNTTIFYLTFEIFKYLLHFTSSQWWLFWLSACILSSRLSTCNKVQCFDISKSQFKVGWCKQRCCERITTLAVFNCLKKSREYFGFQRIIWKNVRFLWCRKKTVERL